MYAKPEERWDYLDDLPTSTARYWKLFMDFRCGGYRMLPDIISDFDDMYSHSESRQRILQRKGDSADLQQMMLGMEQGGDYSSILVLRCREIFSSAYVGGWIRDDDVVKCAVALGKRQFALEVYPAVVLDLAVDHNQEKRKKKRKWRWPWDAERD